MTPFSRFNHIRVATVSVSLILLSARGIAMAAEQASLIHEGDRIIVVGDSITGQSLGASGYVTLMQGAMNKAHPGTKTTFTPLGASGQTVGGWVGTEKKSRDQSFPLDIKTIDVKKTLDGGADVIIIMLGMNDVLHPSMANTPQAVDGWIASYRTLITALRDRTHPRLIALATPSLCTEDLNSPKNLLMDKMSLAMVELAAATNCIILPVREGEKKMLAEGRSRNPDFHVTRDFVHPNPIGHLAIATAMLNGLLENAAVKILNETRSPDLWKAVDGKLPAISYTVEPVAVTDIASSDVQTIKIHFWLNPANSSSKITLHLPHGWASTADSIDASAGEFDVTGALEHLQNNFTLSADVNGAPITADVAIPAAWVVGVGHYGNQGWSVVNKAYKFDSIKGQLPMDDPLSHGIGFGKPTPAPPADGKSRPIAWARYIASVNYTGEADPGSVDIAAIDYFSTFDVAYGIRWVYSPSEQSVPVEFGTQSFAGNYNLCLWLNGQTVRDSSDKKGSADLKLQKGWNSIVFKCNHLEWQWQFDIKLAATPGNTLDDLRFSTVPH